MSSTSELRQPVRLALEERTHIMSKQAQAKAGQDMSSEGPLMFILMQSTLIMTRLIPSRWAGLEIIYTQSALGPPGQIMNGARRGVLAI